MSSDNEPILNLGVGHAWCWPVDGDGIPEHPPVYLGTVQHADLLYEMTAPSDGLDDE